jgi:hypothetical protein
MKLRPIAAVAAASLCVLALAGCGGGSAEYKPIEQYAAAARLAHDAGTPVAIRGKCYNACIVRLASGNVYIDPDAVFSAHVSWPGYGPGERLTIAAYQMVPACARAVLEGRTFAFDPLARVYGSQILAACPEMKPLASS